MRVVEHTEPDVHKLLHIETEGCVVNVMIGLHDMAGRRFTSVEVVSEEPDADGAVWSVVGSGTVIVRRLGRQVLAGDETARHDVPRHDVPSVPGELEAVADPVGPGVRSDAALPARP